LDSAHKIFRYYNSSGANSHAVCVLALSLKKQATAIKTELFIFEKVDQTFIIDWRSILLNNNLLLSTQQKLTNSKNPCSALNRDFYMGMV
jgi:hypothetical protein